MATIGFSNPWMAKLDATAGTYSNGFKCGAAVSGTITPNYQEAKLFADNEVKESSASMTDATVSLTVSDIPATAATVLFGHAVNEKGEVEYKSTDNANYVGLGFYEDEMVDGEVKYLAVILPKVKFNETSKSYATKGDNIAFSTPTIEGTAGFVEAVWQKTKEFETAPEAVAWIKSELSIVSA